MSSKISTNHFLKTIGISITNDPVKGMFYVKTARKVFAFINDRYGVAQTMFEQRVCDLYQGVAVSLLTNRAGGDYKTLKALCAADAVVGERLHMTVHRMSLQLHESYLEGKEVSTGSFAEAIAGVEKDRYLLCNVEAEAAYLATKFPDGKVVGEYFVVGEASTLDFDEVLEEISAQYEKGEQELVFKVSELEIVDAPVLDTVSRFINKYIDADINVMDDVEKKELYWSVSESDFSKGKVAKFASYFPNVEMLVSAFVSRAVVNFRDSGLLTTISDEEAERFVAGQIIRLRGCVTYDRVSGTLKKGNLKK